ncbi:MAG: phosphatase PAP2 family protein [Lautropia sp.]
MLPTRSTLAWLPGWCRRHAPALAVLFVGVLAPLWLFGELAEAVTEHDALAIDEALLRFMQAQAAPALDRWMLTLSLIGSGPWIAAFDVVVATALAMRRRWLDALFWILATGGAALLNVAAKHNYGRIRPDLWVSIAPETSFSFPSGHTMQSMAVATALVILLWHTRARYPVMAAGAAFTLLVGTSRIYLGVHFPTDVAAGWLASLAWVLGVGLVCYRHPVRRLDG